jgi:hypothetical protein
MQIILCIVVSNDILGDLNKVSRRGCNWTWRWQWLGVQRNSTIQGQRLADAKDEA